MAVVIVETGAGLSTANSYVSISEVDVYFDAHLYGSVWAAAALPTRQAAVISATRMVDLYTEFYGVPATTIQALRCPRSGMRNRDGVLYGSTVIPIGLKHAVCELTRFLLASDRAADPDTAGYSSISVGAIAVTMETSDRPDVLPEIVRQMLGEFGSVLGGNNVMQFIPVVRV